MKFLNKREIKIFLTFFFIYSFFIHWGGWYENSVFALTKVIVDEKRFEIDSYANQTSDRAYYKDHYYTDKAPGTSFLATPIYAAWKFIYYNLFPTGFRGKYTGSYDYNITWSNEKVSIISYKNPGFFVLTSMIIVTIFTASLFSALTVVLIYKISRFFTKNESHRLLLTFIYGIGSLAFPNGLSIFTHQIGSFFAFLTFYLFLKMKTEKNMYNGYFLLAGIFLGFATVSDFFMILIGTILFLYFIFVFWNKRRIKKIIRFRLGCFIGLLPFLLYNSSILGFSLESIGKYNDRRIFTAVPEDVFNRYGFLMPNLGVIFQLLIGTYRGLLFYYPIYFLSFLGFFEMIKNHKREAILIFLIFISSLITISSRITWHGGYTFGPRYFLPSIPFFTIPILFTFKNLKSKLKKIVIVFFILFSIFTNLIGLQIYEDWILDKSSMLISDKYQEKINSFQQLANPLTEYYLPLFLIYGPRSLIFENLIEGHIDIDIRDIPFSRSWKYPYVSNNHKSFLSLLPIGIVVGLIWHKEFFYLVKLRKRLKSSS